MTKKLALFDSHNCYSIQGLTRNRFLFNRQVTQSAVKTEGSKLSLAGRRFKPNFFHWR